MDKHEAFAADVTREFTFLEEDYGLRREPHHITSEGSWIIYSGPLVSVVIENEFGGTCGVSIRNLRHVKRDPLERGEFDLDEILAVAGGQKQGRRQDPRSMTESITRAAQSLRSTGATVLQGNFEALEARQRKAVEALRRHNPLTQEKEPAG